MRPFCLKPAFAKRTYSTTGKQHYKAPALIGCKPLEVQVLPTLSARNMVEGQDRQDRLRASTSSRPRQQVMMSCFNKLMVLLCVVIHWCLLAPLCLGFALLSSLRAQSPLSGSRELRGVGLCVDELVTLRRPVGSSCSGMASSSASCRSAAVSSACSVGSASA